MVRKINVTLDGETLRPDGPLDLKLNGRYVVTVDAEESVRPGSDTPYILDQIAALATDMGVTDLAEKHKEYARARKFGGKLPE